ncbi:hypothetical protein SDC9_141354 [bioreactor metagenome]|uniref:Uncharacterized protein n=1 Tax=bioreactor metagenome TaxID=1076179 RepID=A0A645DY64_9ZZZZ
MTRSAVNGNRQRITDRVIKQGTKINIAVITDNRNHNRIIFININTVIDRDRCIIDWSDHNCQRRICGAACRIADCITKADRSVIIRFRNKANLVIFNAGRPMSHI